MVVTRNGNTLQAAELLSLRFISQQARTSKRLTYHVLVVIYTEAVSQVLEHEGAVLLHLEMTGHAVSVKGTKPFPPKSGLFQIYSISHNAL